jgi:hypothetical protein
MTIDLAHLDALRTYDTPTLANALDGLTDRPANRGYTRPPGNFMNTRARPVQAIHFVPRTSAPGERERTVTVLATTKLMANSVAGQRNSRS